jgi:hypothetical protein
MDAARRGDDEVAVGEAQAGHHLSDARAGRLDPSDLRCLGDACHAPRRRGGKIPEDRGAEKLGLPARLLRGGAPEIGAAVVVGDVAQRRMQLG